METVQAVFVAMLLDRLHKAEARLDSLGRELEVQRARLNTLEEDNKKLWPAEPFRVLTDRLRFMLASEDEERLMLDYVRTNANGSFDYVTEQQLTRVYIYNCFCGEKDTNGQRVPQDYLLVDWYQVPVPEGLTPRQTMSAQDMQAVGLVEKLVEGPPGFRLHDVHIRDEDHDFYQPYWQATGTVTSASTAHRWRQPPDSG